MSENVNQSKELSLPKIERILAGREVDHDIPKELEPSALHKIYKEIKSDHYLQFQPWTWYKKWEDSVSKIIAEHYYNYQAVAPEHSKIRIARDKYRGVIEDNSSSIGTDANTMKLYEVSNYFMQTSHQWLIERASFNKKDFYYCKNILKEIGVSDLLIKELKDTFPEYLESKDKYYSRSKIVMERYNPPPKDKSAKSVLNQLRIATKTDISLYDLGHMHPFINIERLVIYFWLEQHELKLTPKMILKYLIDDNKTETHSWDVFIVWLWNIQKIISEEVNKAEKIVIQEQMLKILCRFSDRSNSIKNYCKDGWLNFKYDQRAARDRLLKLLNKLTSKPMPLQNQFPHTPSVELLQNIVKTYPTD